MSAQPGTRHGDLFQDKRRQLILVSTASGAAFEKRQDRFGHLFDDLRAFEPPRAPDDEPGLLEALAAKMAWEDQSEDPSGDSKIPAGYTILGQFITHDLTFSNLPLDGRPDDPTVTNNYRTPRFDLDLIYGLSPQLRIDPPRDDESGKMEYRKSTDSSEPDDLLRYIDVKQPDDLLRLGDEQALIGDLRNDENVMISQLHLAFLKLHNRFVDDIDQHRIDGRRIPGDTTFDKARRLCQWHYQWVVVNDYLPRIIDPATLEDIVGVDGREQCKPRLTFYGSMGITPPTIPVEFSVAAFRFGHTMIRSHYHINDGGPLPLFGYSSGDNRHLGGRRRLEAALVIDWSRFFEDLPVPAALAADGKLARNFARKIDANLTKILRKMPDDALDRGPGFDVKSLAERDLRRGVELELPSGQALAKKMAETVKTIEPLDTAQLGLQDLRWDGEAPLWFYILREAEITQGGEHLGPVGGRIVAEVILGLLACDDESYLNAAPWFQPENPNGLVNRKTFTMADLLQMATVPA
jgi:hypothetical protein